MRIIGWILVAAAALTALVALGARPAVPPLDARAVSRSIPDDPAALDAWIASRQQGIQPGTEEAIRWQGPPGTRTALALVYLHGFSASRRELHPVMDQVADAIGANVVYARLNGHGLIDGDLSEVSASAWLADGERAWQLGTRVGDQVIVIATSTGAPIALDVLARHDHDPRLAGAIFTSPNLKVQNPLAEVLLLPWGAPVLQTAIPTRCGSAKTEDEHRYWTNCYDTHAVVAMQDLLATVRHQHPEDLRTPLRVLYNPHDHVLDTEYARAFLARVPDVQLQTFTPDARRDAHVLAGDYKVPSATPAVVQQLTTWVRDLAGATPGAE